MTLEILEILSRLKNTMSRPLDSLDIDIFWSQISIFFTRTWSYGILRVCCCYHCSCAEERRQRRPSDLLEIKSMEICGVSRISWIIQFLSKGFTKNTIPFRDLQENCRQVTDFAKDHAAWFEDTLVMTGSSSSSDGIEGFGDTWSTPAVGEWSE